MRYEAFARLVREKGIRERIIVPGDRIGITPAGECVCLHPRESDEIYSPRGENSRVNNHSMVLKLVYGKVSILFTGDIEEAAEKRLVESLPEDELASTMLKASHHGSKNSSSALFLNAVKPAIRSSQPERAVGTRCLPHQP